jgi:tetratricopeptide (TPR) repeat protein
VLESGQEEHYYYLEDILEQSGSEQAVAYFERHFDKMAKSDKETLASAIEALPRKSFIERLVPLTGKGQGDLDRAYLILNKLHGIESEALADLEEEYLEKEAEAAERRALLDITNLAAITRDELNLEMECSVCGDISHYAVESVFISGTEPKPFIADELICLGCGAEDTLTLTSTGAMTVTVELMRLTAITDKTARKEAAENSPLTIVPRLTAMGREMGISEAIALYKKEIAAHPAKVELQLGYANILRFIKRFDKAADCYTEAVRIEPRLIEGWFELSQLEHQQGNYQKAFFALYEGARHLPHIVFHQTKPNERSEFINSYVTGYNEYKKRVNIPGPLLSHGMFGTQTKVGRNDPCSCGSGKKFKKCCGK